MVYLFILVFPFRHAST